MSKGGCNAINRIRNVATTDGFQHVLQPAHARYNINLTQQLPCNYNANSQNLNDITSAAP